MLNRQQKGEAARLTADRRRREDEAPRLIGEVPHLASLRLDIKEGKPNSAIATAAHIRRIVVATAPALFVVRCGETDCKEGGVHDFTHDVMWALRRNMARVEGDVPCDGCPCVLRFVATAVYSKSEAEGVSPASPEGAPRRPGRAGDAAQ